MSTKRRARNWSIDSQNGTVKRRGLFFRPRRLEPRLFRVLDLLMQRAGSTVSQEEILTVAWEGRVVSGDSVSTAIYQLRKFLGEDAKDPQSLFTVPHEGYTWVTATPGFDFGTVTKGLIIGLPTGVVAGLIAAALALNYHSGPELDTLFIAPMVNSTGDPAIEFSSIAVDATLVSALVRSNPNILATRNQDADSRFRLESEVVTCDSGPALVLTLIDSENQLYLWSEHYAFYGDFYEPSMVEHAVKRVSRALTRT